MIKNWQKVLLTFVVGALVYLFSVATADYNQIRATVMTKADANSEPVGNALRFSEIVEPLSERYMVRVKSLRALEQSLPTEQAEIDSALLTLDQAKKDCASDTARACGFSTNNSSTANVQKQILAALKSESDLRAAVIAKMKHDPKEGSTDLAVLDGQVSQTAETAWSAVNEEEGRLGDLDEKFGNFIREQERLYKVLGVKILLALFFVITGGLILFVSFLRERGRALSHEQSDQKLSA
jgi:hypothetical protein